jgi:hypothetical protein
MSPKIVAFLGFALILAAPSLRAQNAPGESSDQKPLIEQANARLTAIAEQRNRALDESAVLLAELRRMTAELEKTRKQCPAPEKKAP